MKLFNTATREKETLVPIKDNHVGIYSCGPTVYSSPHIGNLYAYINWDILVRFLRYTGYDVTHVMNITDVGHLVSDEDTGEDKMEKGSRKEGVSVWQLAKKYEDEFRDSMKLLNIVEPNIVCRATDNIKEQIAMVKTLIDKGFTYEISDGIYFDTSKFPDYAKFANLNLDKIREGARVGINKEKRNPSDFALWKFSGNQKPRRQMEWFFDGPKSGELATEEDLNKNPEWVKIVGFPGWHIECTAMSTKYLGEKFDIHTGGEDHIPVHHTNEIAQAFGIFGHRTANFWIHNAFITMKEGKMSKSLGNVYTVKQLQEMGYTPLVFRYLVLTSHYKKGLTFSIESLESAENALQRLRQSILSWKENTEGDNGEINEKYKSEFINAINDDLSMPEAMAVIWNLVRDKDVKNENKLATLLDFDKVLGLNLLKTEQIESIPEEIVQLVDRRETARNEKNWTESDRLRNLIQEKGYVVEDLKNGCKIRKIKTS